MNRASQLAAAQRAYENQSPDESGDEADERIEQLAAELSDDPLARRVAASWCGGEFSAQHYEAVDLALFDLHTLTDAELLASPVLATLRELAATVHAEYAAWFRKEAERMDAERCAA